MPNYDWYQEALENTLIVEKQILTKELVAAREKLRLSLVNKQHEKMSSNVEIKQKRFSTVLIDNFVILPEFDPMF